MSNYFRITSVTGKQYNFNIDTDRIIELDGVTYAMIKGQGKIETVMSSIMLIKQITEWKLNKEKK